MPENAIIGDNFGTDLPKTEVREADLIEEKKLARYSKTQEFKRLKDFCEGRIEFYQRFLPTGEKVEGDPVSGGLVVNKPVGDLTANWIAACIVIKEFQNILDTYKQAKEAVDDATRT